MLSVQSMGLAWLIAWIGSSTGGGAALEFIEQGDLPGLQALRDGCEWLKRSRQKERKPLISGNWKMNLNHFEAIQTVQKLYLGFEARGLPGG